MQGVVFALAIGLMAIIVIPIGLNVLTQTNNAVKINDSGFNLMFALVGIVLAGIALFAVMRFAFQQPYDGGERSGNF